MMIDECLDVEDLKVRLLKMNLKPFMPLASELSVCHKNIIP